MLAQITDFFVPLGWGKNDFANTGAYQAIMKDVDISLVETNSCQTQLRTTRLGSTFLLDATSFMCAGGEAGKDGRKFDIAFSLMSLLNFPACTGDGGSPLVSQNSWKFKEFVGNSIKIGL
jgi:hypothetical protein